MATFEQEPYISLKTFRRDGRAVATPVWSAPANGHLYVFSAGDAGKVKRLRNNMVVEIAPCDMRGKLLGPWTEGTAVCFDDPAEIDVALTALRKKYGWQMRLADWGAKLTGRFNRRAYIRISLPD